MEEKSENKIGSFITIPIDNDTFCKVQEVVYKYKGDATVQLATEFEEKEDVGFIKLIKKI